MSLDYRALYRIDTLKAKTGLKGSIQVEDSQMLIAFMLFFNIKTT